MLMITMSIYLLHRNGFPIAVWLGNDIIALSETQVPPPKLDRQPLLISPHQLEKSSVETEIDDKKLLQNEGIEHP